MTRTHTEYHCTPVGIFNSCRHIRRSQNYTSCFPPKNVFSPAPPFSPVCLSLCSLALSLSAFFLCLSLTFYTLIHHVDSTTATFVKWRKMFKSAFLCLYLPTPLAIYSRYTRVRVCSQQTGVILAGWKALYIWHPLRDSAADAELPLLQVKWPDVWR